MKSDKLHETLCHDAPPFVVRWMTEPLSDAA